MTANGIAHLQPGLVLTIHSPKTPTLTGCRVERGLGGKPVVPNFIYH